MNYNIYEVIKSPIVSEKSTGASAFSKYMFDVASDANKTLVKDAIEKIFKVTVSAVNILHRKGKLKTYRGRKGKQQDRKIAVVTLSSGQQIDLAEGL